MGMKATFMDSSILICVPTMIFATSFALTLDLDGTLLLYQRRKVLIFARTCVGLGLSLSVDFLFK